MSGRGRGRGRGGGPPSGARLLLQRSAKEAGLDDRNLKNLQNITKPELFPDFNWHSSGQKVDPNEPLNTPEPQKRSAATIYLINKSREIHHRFQASPYYVRPTQEPDVVRYGKRPRPAEPDVSILELMGDGMNDARYLPSELLQETGVAELSMKEMDSLDIKPKKALTIEEVAAREMKRRQEEKRHEEGENGDAEYSDAAEDGDEEEEVADYTTNYYASDDEQESGGDEEAVF